jgi:hypothetical protein
MGNSSFHPERSKLPPGGTFGLSDPGDPELDPEADPDPDPVPELDVEPDDPDDPDEPAPDPELDPPPLPVDAPDDDAPLEDDEPLDDEPPDDDAPPDDPPATCQGGVAVSPQAAHTHKAAAATREERGAEGLRSSLEDMLNPPSSPEIRGPTRSSNRAGDPGARARVRTRTIAVRLRGYGTNRFVPKRGRETSARIAVTARG